MSDNPIRDTFFEECEDLLEALNEGLSQMSDGDHDAETVNAVFRAVHSIKGGAGAFALEDLVGFAHKFETVLDLVRSDELGIDDTVMHILQRAGDQISILVEAARDETGFDEDLNASLAADLSGLMQVDGVDTAPAPEPEFVFEALTLDVGPMAVDATTTYDIRFRPNVGLYKNGHEPAFIFGALDDIGTLSVEIDHSDVPDLTELEPEESYLSWRLSLTSDEGRPKVEEVFEFVDQLCELEITEALPDAALSPEPTPAFAPMPNVETPQTPLVIEAAPAPDAAKTPAPPPAAEPAKKSAPSKKAETGGSSGPKATLRVDLDRVDRLINTVGELIINQAMIAQRLSLIELKSGTDIENDLDDYRRLARDIQDAVMAIRAQPVKPLFQRMSRIVREANDATSKKAELVFEGEGTEVDKTLIERLADPLTHMIRNAVDHGIETPDDRLASGKDGGGTIVLSAVHQSGSVLIKVRDDGAGLNRAKIKDIAVTKELIPADADLTDSEIDNLLFLPGFSTATEVSNLSGRGVGMDVVKNAITGLGGRVSISSVPGQGTTFTIVLPLTLAVMDGMVVKVTGETLVVPISAVVETIRPKQEDLHAIGHDEMLLSIRGSFVPVVNVADRLGFSVGKSDSQPPVCLLVDTQNKGYCAFTVDDILDQRQVVVKGLGEAHGEIPGISAATILGDGKIALILDPSKLVAEISLPSSADAVMAQPKEVMHADAL